MWKLFQKYIFICSPTSCKIDCWLISRRFIYIRGYTQWIHRIFFKKIDIIDICVCLIVCYIVSIMVLQVSLVEQELLTLSEHLSSPPWYIVSIMALQVSLVEQELPTLSEHPSSPPVFSWVRVTQSLVLYVCFVDRCSSFCTFSFGHWCCLFFFDIRIMITSLVSSNSSYEH